MNSPGNEEHPAVEPASAASRRPGHELGAARERAGISLEEMATRLNLSRHSVEALERDDYQHLPTAAFVRGYLRAYAKEVGMDGDALVAEFDAVSGPTDAPELVVSEGVPDPGSGRGPTIAILILVAVVAIGAGAWWFQQPALTLQPEPEAPAATGDGDDVEPDTSGETDAFGGGTEPGEETEAEPEAPDAGTEPGATLEPEAGDSATVESDGAVNGDAAGAMQASPDGGDSPDDAADTEEVVAEAAESADESDIDETNAAEAETGGPLATSDAELAATSAAASGPDRLEIAVDGESWIEVYDSRGRRLVYTLYSGSTPVALNGWAPFDVFLGNSPAVTVRIGEQVIDQSAFVRSDNTARFLADSEGARRR